MNRKYYTAFAVSAVAMGAVAFTATESWATHVDPEPGAQSVPPTASDWPDEASGYPGSQNTTPEYNYPNYDPKYEVAQAAPSKTTAQSSSDGNGFQFVQSGASAVAGAAVAVGGMWVYRRRQLPTT